MRERKEGGVEMVDNPITKLEKKYNEFEMLIKNWLAKQSLPVEASIVTFAGAIKGGAIGGFMGSLSIPAHPCTSNDPHSNAVYSQPAGGPLIHARNFAVMSGVNAGISCVMRRLRGKEDVQTTMVAAFGSGVMFSLVSGIGGPNQAANVISSGVLFAIVQGGIFKATLLLHRSP